MSQRHAGLSKIQVKAIRDAARRNDPEALCQMGDFHADGIHGHDYSRKRALRYYRRAAEAGFAEGQYKSACIILDLSKPGPGELSDYMDSAALAKKAASQGHAASKIHLQTIWSILTNSMGVDLRTEFRQVSANMDPVRCAALANDIFSFLHDLGKAPAGEAAPAANI